jgi:hypothetical protein
VELLRHLIELRAEPADHVFKNTLRDPIDQRSFYKIFCSAQRAIGIRIRELYATKDSYVSTALTRGVNLAWLSEQTGVSDATLRRHYGKFIHADAGGHPGTLKNRLPRVRIGAVCPSVAPPRGSRRKKAPSLKGKFGGAEGI